MTTEQLFTEFYGWLLIIMNFINSNKILMILFICSLLCGADRVIYWLTDD